METHNLSSHELTLTVLMTPDMSNFSGKVHGGAILKKLDEVAYACASRYAGSYVVTLSVDQVIFKQPINVGELVTFLASINYAGTSSMEVGIKVVAENIQQRSVRHTNSCYFTMVAVNGEGRPQKVPELDITTPLQQLRFEKAQLRRKLRKQAMEEEDSATREYLRQNPESTR
ncbi:acyl-CoA thioesterase [Kushneria aurantia]|uniref:Acyl-CoA thioesterase n=1 Tax=Kushneria aurantia TaxID=504092 RepID=A0ABV6G392_9GAMM|nr:acyl-CoA thioesterase [Kushneria aurantia]